MRIAEYDLYEVPPRWLFLRLETSSGRVGWGEPIVEGRARTVRAAVEEVMDNYLLGEDPSSIEDHWQTMYRGGFYRGGPVLMSAIAGIDQALWDIKGKQLGAPIYELLGGQARERIRCYQAIGGGDPEPLRERAREAVDDGFTALKMGPFERLRRVDTPEAVQTAAEQVAAVRDEVGPGIDIALDFHGRVSKPMAKRAAAAVEPYDPMFIEEPVLPEHNDLLPKLAEHTTIPIATGERMYSRWDFKEVLESGAVDVIQPDLSHAGGITEVKKIADMAEAYDAALAPHCPLGPIALASCLQVDMCAPNALIQEQSLDIHYHEGEGDPLEYVANATALEFEDGYVTVPSTPGLGIEVDETVVERRATNVDWHNPVWRHEDGGVAEW